MTVVQIPRRGLSYIDLRFIEFTARFLGWGAEIVWTLDHQAFAVFGWPELEDFVFVLTKEARAYVLTKFPPESDTPRVYAKGTPQAVFEVLPPRREYHRPA